MGLEPAWRDAADAVRHSAAAARSVLPLSPMVANTALVA